MQGHKKGHSQGHDITGQIWGRDRNIVVISSLRFQFQADWVMNN